MAAEHLVANLKQVARIEEGPRVEQFVLDLLDVGMEKSPGAQEGGLRVGRRILGHGETSRERKAG
jgi:hypothetical protein